MSKKFDDRLVKILKKETIRQKWMQKLRITGAIVREKTTAEGNVMLMVTGANKDYNVVVPKQRKKGFELAKSLKEGETVKITGGRKIVIILCDRIEKLNKADLSEKQTKLTEKF